MMEGDVQDAALKRLEKIAGQVRGLSKMVEEGRYCIDILRQIMATEAALHSLGEIILRNHLETCVTDAFQSSNPRERKVKIQELIHVFDEMRFR